MYNIPAPEAAPEAGGGGAALRPISPLRLSHTLLRVSIRLLRLSYLLLRVSIRLSHILIIPTKII